MTVTKGKLEQALERVRAEVRDPRAGVFGPGSCTWIIGREVGVFVGAGRAALLQLAHPFVAHAVEQHSATKTDPAGRFLRTFESVFPMVFGDLDSAFACARRVHGMHRSIAGFVDDRVGTLRPGDAYHANHEGALFWVAATLWDTAVLCYELLLGPLSPAFKEQYYREAKRFAWLFGIPDEEIPETWLDFEAYNRRMWSSDTLRVGRAAGDLGRFLMAPPRPLLAPVVKSYGMVTAALLPEPLRQGYGLPLGRVERGVFRASVGALRRVYGQLPPRMRFLPAYRDALRRVERRPRGPLGSALEDRLREAAQAGLERALRRAA